MYYTYKEIKNEYGNDYQIKEAINNHEIYKIKPGLYTDQKNLDQYAIVFKSIKKAILTLQSAFYYYGLTDYIPEQIVVATPKNSYSVQIEGVKQIFMSNKYLDIGQKTIRKNGYNLKIYDIIYLLCKLIFYT